MKFYKCDTCGKILTMLNETAVPTICCGAPMKELIAGSTDAAQEKHVPVVTREGNQVKVAVGSVLHPMTEAHLIEWIVLETTKGSQTRYLKPEEEPTAVFQLAEGEEVAAVYAYCNLHGLWKA